MSTEFKSSILLRLLDEPRIYVRWTLGELCSFSVPFFAMFLAQQFIAAFVLGGLGAYVAKKLKRLFGRDRGIFHQAAYRYLGVGNAKGWPASSITEYLT